MHPPRPSSLGGWGKDFRKVFAGRGQKGLFWWEVILLEGGGGDFVWGRVHVILMDVIHQEYFWNN